MNKKALYIIIVILALVLAAGLVCVALLNGAGTDSRESTGVYTSGNPQETQGNNETVNNTQKPSENLPDSTGSTAQNPTDAPQNPTDTPENPTDAPQKPADKQNVTPWA